MLIRIADATARDPSFPQAAACGISLSPPECLGEIVEGYEMDHYVVSKLEHVQEYRR